MLRAVSATGGATPARDGAFTARPAVRRLEPQRATGPRVLVVDAYDSFTFNLVQQLLELGAVVEVVAGDAVTVPEVLARDPTHIILSPGPGRPEDAGIAMALARDGVADEIPLLGVCLGHQALCVAFGGTVAPAPRIVHGKVSRIDHDGTGLFAGLPRGFAATRYHSLATLPQTVRPPLRAIAFAEDGTLMAVAHVRRPAFGVQFHPESILTEHGHALMQRFLARGAPT